MIMSIMIKSMNDYVSKYVSRNDKRVSVAQTRSVTTDSSIQ